MERQDGSRKFSYAAKWKAPASPRNKQALLTAWILQSSFAGKHSKRAGQEDEGIVTPPVVLFASNEGVC